MALTIGRWWAGFWLFATMAHQLFFFLGHHVPPTADLRCCMRRRWCSRWRCGGYRCRWLLRLTQRPIADRYSAPARL